jgi:hypothetical protein
MDNLGIFYDHLVYFTAIGNILFPFCIFCGDFVYFSPFWYFGPRKIWQPCFKRVELIQKTTVKLSWIYLYSGIKQAENPIF